MGPIYMHVCNAFVIVCNKSWVSPKKCTSDPEYSPIGSASTFSTVFLQVLCAVIAALVQYLFLVSFGLMLVLSVNLYWKVSSLSRGAQGDSSRKTALCLLSAYGMDLQCLEAILNVFIKLRIDNSRPILV